MNTDLMSDVFGYLSPKAFCDIPCVSKYFSMLSIKYWRNALVKELGLNINVIVDYDEFREWFRLYFICYRNRKYISRVTRSIVLNRSERIEYYTSKISKKERYRICIDHSSLLISCLEFMIKNEGFCICMEKEDERVIFKNLTKCGHPNRLNIDDAKKVYDTTKKYVHGIDVLNMINSHPTIGLAVAHHIGVEGMTKIYEDNKRSISLVLISDITRSGLVFPKSVYRDSFNREIESSKMTPLTLASYSSKLKEYKDVTNEYDWESLLPYKRTIDLSSYGMLNYLITFIREGLCGRYRDDGSKTLKMLELSPTHTLAVEISKYISALCLLEDPNIRYSEKAASNILWYIIMSHTLPLVSNYCSSISNLLKIIPKNGSKTEAKAYTSMFRRCLENVSGPKRSLFRTKEERCGNVTPCVASKIASILIEDGRIEVTSELLNDVLDAHDENIFNDMVAKYPNIPITLELMSKALLSCTPGIASYFVQRKDEIYNIKDLSDDCKLAMKLLIYRKNKLAL